MRLFDFNRYSIRGKLTLIAVLTSALVLLLVALVFIFNVYVTMRASLLHSGMTMAKVLASNVTAAVAFQDADTANEILSAFRAEPSIVQARILDENGKIFAVYDSRRPEHQDLLVRVAASPASRVSAATPPGASTIFHDGFLEIIHPIEINGRRRANLDLAIDLSPLWERVHAGALAASAVLLIALLLASFLAWRLSLAIARPIQSLSSTLKRVTERDDYSLRAERYSSDELGTLTDGFNEMLDQIQRRDLALAKLVEQLKLSKENAEEANRSKSLFLAAMSHEIRTPMNGVLGMAELLKGTGLNERQRRFAETLQRSGEALLEIINDILDFSKIEAGKLMLDENEFDLRELVEDIGELMATRAHEKELDLLISLPPDMPDCFVGDANRLRQVLVNLVGNAVKFTHEGEVVLRVAVHDAGRGVTRLDFSVRDTGIGIEPKACERIFDAFSQADSSTTRRFGGTGLGLAISRQLVSLMGGELQVASAPGVGSNFHFSLTLPSRRDSARRRDWKLDELHGLRVLIVDDNATNREILHNQVAAWGLRDDCVARGSEALQRLRDASGAGKPFGVAIVDRHMPGMNGIDLIDAMSADPRLAATRILLMSSGSDEDEGTARADVDGYLTKPVRQRHLYEALRRIVVGDPLEDPAPPTARETLADLRCEARILLAEDNPVNQEVARSMLEPLGCRISVAANGNEALKQLTESDFDLVLMDCHMPELDGFDAAREIRRREQGGPGIPIIALTANVQKGIEAQCREAGMNDYLSKPFRQEQLLALLRRWLPKKIASHRTHGEAPGNDEVEVEGLESGDGVIDDGALESIRILNKPKLLDKVIDIYLTTTPELVAEIHAGGGEGDMRRVRQAAHSLKSASANLGAFQVAELCRSLEEAADGERLEQVRELEARLDALHARACGALDARRGAVAAG